jgi:hypothetical protein
VYVIKRQERQLLLAAASAAHCTTAVVHKRFKSGSIQASNRSFTRTFTAAGLEARSRSMIRIERGVRQIA